MGPYCSSQIRSVCLCRSLHCVLSPATLPGNWGISMATEYRITSFASRQTLVTGAEYGLRTQLVKSHVVAQQKPTPTKKTKQEKHCQKNHQI